MLYAPSSSLKDPAVLRELQRISQVISALSTGELRVLHKEPAKPRDGETAICDGTDWDPLSLGVKQPVWYDADVPAWKAL